MRILYFLRNNPDAVSRTLHYLRLTLFYSAIWPFYLLLNIQLRSTTTSGHIAVPIYYYICNNFFDNPSAAKAR